MQHSPPISKHHPDLAATQLVFRTRAPRIEITGHPLRLIFPGTAFVSHLVKRLSTGSDPGLEDSTPSWQQEDAICVPSPGAGLMSLTRLCQANRISLQSRCPLVNLGAIIPPTPGLLKLLRWEGRQKHLE